MRSHEYVHVLQYEMKGSGLMMDYLNYSVGQGAEGTPRNPYEAIAYIWQGWYWAYREASWDRYWPNCE